MESFDPWVVYEFHLYDTYQQACLFWTIGVRRRRVRSRPTIALLLSATPRASERLRQWAQALGLEWKPLSQPTLPPLGRIGHGVQESLELWVHAGNLEQWDEEAIIRERIVPLWEQAPDLVSANLPASL
ncbi:MAG: hypothetical protein NZ742_02530 [Acidobacteria bacterium]|nr:hypothetical protein [Acidobacteriota bacterium]MDW7983217.1 hypothetical protein [Acidobacteriota bacterium]